MTADLAATIEPKSDQLNADNLIAEPRTVRITKVVAGGSVEQPIAIYFEGDDGKPYKPCKSMRRALLQVWGRDGNAYVGRSMTLYRDPSVKFGGVDVGGIRISHMSDISAPMTFPLTASRTVRKPYTVQPLVIAPKSGKSLQDRVAGAETAVKACNTIVSVEGARKKSAPLRAELERSGETELLGRLDLAFEGRVNELEAAKEK